MEWKIKQGGEECAQCKKFFIRGEDYFSTVIVEEGLLQRSDFCEACFEAQEPENRESFWKTRKTQVKEVKKTVNFELLRELYFKMLTMKEKEIKELAYLIGLILVRKRFLRLKNFVSEEDGDFMLVQQKKDAPVVRMEVPLLAEEDIAVLRDRLSDLLDTDLGSMLDPRELREKFVAPANAPAPETAPVESTAQDQADDSSDAPGEAAANADASGDVPDEAAAIADASGDVPGDAAANADASGDAPGGAVSNQDASGDELSEAAENQATVESSDATGQAHVDTSDGKNGEAPAITSADASLETSEDAPKRTPKDTPAEQA